MKSCPLILDLSILFTIQATAQNAARPSACNDPFIVHQADSIKQSLNKDGFVIVKEAFVPMESEFNNGSQIQHAFSQAAAKSASFIGMVENADDLIENMKLVNENYQLFLDRTDFTLLGMGEDGHTASLFPNDPASAVILESDSLGIFPTKAPNYPFQRITCSKQMLLNSTALVLFIVGEKKLEILNNSSTAHLPISSFLENVPNLEVYYAK